MFVWYVWRCSGVVPFFSFAFGILNTFEHNLLLFSSNCRKIWTKKERHCWLSSERSKLGMGSNNIIDFFSRHFFYHQFYDERILMAFVSFFYCILTPNSSYLFICNQASGWDHLNNFVNFKWLSAACFDLKFQFKIRKQIKF